MIDGDQVKSPFGALPCNFDEHVPVIAVGVEDSNIEAGNGMDIARRVVSRGTYSTENMLYPKSPLSPWLSFRI